MAKAAKPVPEGYHTVSPYLVIRDAAKAIEFYKQAFGARERYRMPGPDGRLMHAELEIGDSILMLSEEFPEMGAPSPQTLNGTTVSIFLYVPDVDAVFKKAVAAGAKELTPVADMFWGDRFGKVADPFGHQWQIATHKEDLTPEEMGKRAEEFFKQAKT
jgi:PhnB protein